MIDLDITSYESALLAINHDMKNALLLLTRIRDQADMFDTIIRSLQSQMYLLRATK